ncbi:MAG: Dihydroorotate dehydrogenase 2 [Candidatus Woesebacteria bacterium GW2011_GWB1_43_14]|uniref:Dihydroorotate dehydrogenase (quinone) n=1 Tax=Candidatus Woesebacteria bacterium GW2011_GWB1_43_14 TaxID=1618578 RepID=A0A0G1DHP9_9BACT|nr:MAG: Dihydroorotate dehydrogenase 2 [Candidatus Woesebacteria bacterium GW2011_GWA1_39_11b]KKS77602.1 MAG: dihydroorotate dehydrogenase 2 [Candidatus Woesebacteria bacterium GW2011_GWC1_42_9]KKS97087.1 MAG: Dihydroorotate dehydrogenase 2 [Candidatus Woesebacteria bacterium GW2011_GWB1_43_14]
MISKILRYSYQSAKPALFLLDSESIHNHFTSFGKYLGSSALTRNMIKNLFFYEDKKLVQKIEGLKFENPIGLAAGFDYDGNLTQILPKISFGFSTVGTVTNMSYDGNPAPRLGRLPKSKSLLVNKGFKSRGAAEIIKKLGGLKFDAPVGISIGRTNSAKLTTIKESINDILASFASFEKSKVRHSYYELNISCPNLIHGAKNITFYPPRNLNNLLTSLDKLRIKKPIFIKMPITESNEDFLKMLKVIVKHKVCGVIIGNLEKNRKNQSFNKVEISKATAGNFSGLPCRKRSNELISLTYRHYGDKLIIIGCGGVFSAEDAYEKICRGASLVQLITGLIYEGPQLPREINEGLIKLIARDQYKSINEAVGSFYF